MFTLADLGTLDFTYRDGPFIAGRQDALYLGNMNYFYMDGPYVANVGAQLPIIAKVYGIPITSIKKLNGISIGKIFGKEP